MDQTVNGFQIQLLLKELHSRRDLASALFPQTLHYFEGETPRDPVKAFKEVLELERKIAALQTAQARYNLQVVVDVQGQTISLQEAVKRVGGTNRLAKLWRAGLPKKESGPRWARSSDDHTERSKEKEYARCAIDDTLLVHHAVAWERTVSALKAAIQRGNATEVPLEDLNLSAETLG